MIKRVRSNLRKRLKVVAANYQREMDAILEEYLTLCDAADEEQTKPDRVRKISKPVKELSSSSSSSEEEEVVVYDDSEPQEEEGEDEDEEDDVCSMSRELSESDSMPEVDIGLNALVEDLKLSTNFQQPLDNSRWFQKRYGDILDSVRANMGRQSATGQEKAHEVFDSIRNQWSRVRVDRLERSVRETCCLCNSTRRCTHVLYQDDEELYVAAQCVEVATALIAFFDVLRDMVEVEEGDYNLRRLDQAFEGVMAAHAGKNWCQK